MINRHLITPPPELVREWQREANHNEAMFPQVAAQAAQWGAKQELEACCEWLESNGYPGTASELNDLRRPQPPSLKAQALALVNSNKPYLDDTAMDTIRRALEQLND
jgi:hypothetical protein